MTPVLGAVTAFLALQLGVGAWVARRIRTEEDYLLAGRGLGPALCTFSLFATWFGAETIVGAAGSAHADGLSLASPEPFGYGLCLVIMGAVFAAPLWRRGLTTLADLYRTRYGPAAEKVAAVLLLPSSVVWAAAEIRAFGAVVHDAAPAVSLTAAIVLASGAVVAYTAVGGLRADATNDLVQGCIIAVGLIAVVIAAAGAVGGAGPFLEAALAHRPARAPVGPLAAVEAWAIPVIGSAAATELVSRVIGARSATVARGASLAAAGLYIVLGAIPVLVGLAATQLAGPVAGEAVFPAVAQQVLPRLGYAVFTAAFLAAILSTVDSTLLVAGGITAHNIVGPLLGARSERAKVAVSRAAVAGFGVIATGIALTGDGVAALVETASALGGAGAFVTVTFALFTRWGGAAAAIASQVGGIATYLLGVAAGWTAPFLASLGAAVGLYAVGAVVHGPRRGRAGRASPP